LGFPLVPVERTQGDSFVVPSVVHLRQNHFVAIIGQSDDFYWVLDPAAFEHARWVAATDLNSEVSGRFLVSPRQIPLNWRLLKPE
jgi:ABC-type bacteriocin/lantibiotic exporter with double-glycine peptidase domain